MNGWVVFLLVVGAYLAVYLALRNRKGPLPGNFEFMGPFLFWRTQLGKKAIEKVARPKRFWNAVADVGIVVTWFTGFAVFALLLLGLAQYFLQPQDVVENAPPPEFLIGLPGVNPLIPVGYGILALVVALVIHEGSHGVMAYVANMRVKSLGLVVFAVPVGAFVEPHEEDLMRSTTRAKNRVFAAGPTSNLVLALAAGFVLSSLMMAHVGVANDGEGMVIGSVEAGSAADAAGLEPGDLVTHLNGQPVSNLTAYREFMEGTREGERLGIDLLRDGRRVHTEATLGSLREYAAAQGRDDPSLEGRGFLGVSGVGLSGISAVRDALAHPFSSLTAFLFFVSYPFFIFTNGVDVLAPPFNELLVVGGPLGALPPAVFFGLATLLYWVVWLNLMLGTFNALPAGPLDGGQMLKATLTERYMRRFQVDRERVDVERLEMGGLALRGRDEETQAKLERVQGVVSRTTRALGFFILGLILLPVFGPPLLRLFM